MALLTSRSPIPPNLRGAGISEGCGVTHHSGVTGTVICMHIGRLFVQWNFGPGDTRLQAYNPTVFFNRITAGKITVNRQSPRQ